MSIHLIQPPKIMAVLLCAGISLMGQTIAAPHVYGDEKEELQKLVQKLRAELEETRDLLKRQQAERQVLEKTIQKIESKFEAYVQKNKKLVDHIDDMTLKFALERRDSKKIIHELQSNLEKAKAEAADARAEALRQAKFAAERAKLLELQAKKGAKKIGDERDDLLRDLLKKVQQLDARVDKNSAILRKLLERKENTPKEEPERREPKPLVPEEFSDEPDFNPKAERNPPPKLIKGEVKGVGKEGLILIEIGSDAGLEKGHTLEVFRRNPQPQYLGVIRIVEVGKKPGGRRPTSSLSISGKDQIRRSSGQQDQAVSRHIPSTGAGNGV